MAKPRWSRKLAEAHLIALSVRHDIDIIWLTGSDWQHAEAFHVSGTVRIPRPYNMRYFLVALHEFGHLLDPTARKLWAQHPDVIAEYQACEAAAWGWALQNVPADLQRHLTKGEVFQTHRTLAWSAWQAVQALRGRVR